MAYVVEKTGVAVEGLGEWEQTDRNVLSGTSLLVFGIFLMKAWKIYKKS